jgi:hypothetical protein
MNKLSLTPLLLLLAFGLVFSSKTSAQSFDSIASAIRSGNASSLAANFSGTVEITIKDAEASYSKAQAEMVLKNFFGTHQPKSFSIVHQGTSPEGSKYFIGNLTTSSGNYRTYVYAKIQGNALVIQEIRFEEQ